jgi:hypothetical protein
MKSPERGTLRTMTKHSKNLAVVNQRRGFSVSKSERATLSRSEGLVARTLHRVLTALY